MLQSKREHAVVLGGSIAGLLAARVLADKYASVTIVERDRLQSSGHRRGVPQGNHVHGLLPRGLQVVEELLPGFTDDVVAMGAHRGDILGNVRWQLLGRQLRQAPTGLMMVSGSRPLLEFVIRRRVLALPNVTVLDGYDIVGVSASRDRRWITAARVTSAHGDGSRLAPADLVVDATGRGSRTPLWLAALGYEAPQGDTVSIDLAYASRIFDAPSDLLGDDLVIVTGRFPGQRRGGVLQRIEGDRILATLAGVLGERPPLDLDGFVAYAGTLATPDIHDAVSSARPIGDAMRFRCPTYVRHRYERLEALPSGLLVVGDAVCALNPIYAHGMSVAAINAMVLRDELQQDGEPDPRRFFAAMAPVLDPPWLLAAGADLAMPGVSGPELPSSPITGEYIGQLQEAAAQDPDVATALVRVNALVDPLPALLRPDVVERVTRSRDQLVALPR